MSDDKMPEQPTTKAFTPPDKQELLHAELKALVTAGFRAAEERFNRQDATLQTLADNDLKSTERMTRFEVRLEDLETGRTKHSGGIKGLSQSDDGQNMQIASLAVKVDAIAAAAVTRKDLESAVVDAVESTSIAHKEALIEGAKEFAKKPIVQRLGTAAAVLLLAAMSVATGYLTRAQTSPTPQTHEAPR